MPALGWPVDEGKRREIESMVGVTLPFYNGSTKDTCSDCGLEIWIGPRVGAAVRAGARPICAFCAITSDQRVHLVNLWNPDTGYGQ